MKQAKKQSQSIDTFENKIKKDPQIIFGGFLFVTPFFISLFTDLSYSIGRQVNTLDPTVPTQIAFVCILGVMSIGWVLLTWNQKNDLVTNFVKLLVLPLFFGLYFILNFALNFAR